MSDELEARAIFIDTAVFYRRDYAINDVVFTGLMTLCQEGKIRLLLTDITLRELEGKIEEKYGEFIGPVVRANKKGAFVRNLDLELTKLSQLASESAAGLHLEALKDRFHRFLEDAGAEILPTADVSVKEVFDNYFERKPPFSEKKKSEFPDAFALAALQNWCDDNDEKVYVVSHDGDMKSACDESSALLYRDGDELPKLIELALQIRTSPFETGTKWLETENRRLQAAHDRFAEVRSEIEEQASERLQDLSVYLEDEDGEAYETRVKELSLEPESVVSLSEDRAVYSLNSEVSLEVDVDYVDPDSIFRDDDIKDYIALGSIQETLTKTLTVPIEVSLDLDPSDVYADSFPEVTVNSGEPLWIYVTDPVW